MIHVFTHDSIGLGEDGPTHQPVEHLPALRAIPNLYMFRPCDAVEAAECWQAALLRDDGPSALALSRQATPALRDDASENLSARGAYELLPAEGGASRVAIFATGTEVALAVKAREMLQAEGMPTRVVSAPCFELFAQQSDDYQDAVCGDDEELKIGVEAAVGRAGSRRSGSTRSSACRRSGPRRRRRMRTRVSASRPKRSSRRRKICSDLGRLGPPASRRRRRFNDQRAMQDEPKPPARRRRSKKTCAGARGEAASSRKE